MRLPASRLGPAALIAVVIGTSCRSDHAVSPFPEGFGIEAWVQPPDLQAQLDRVDKEMAVERMSKAAELRGAFSDHSPFVILGFSGEGGVHRERHAVRVATGFGVILALGPRDPTDLSRARRHRLVESLGGGGGWKSGTDLNGDGHPDVVVRSEDGTFDIWCLMPKGASPYPMRSIAPPDHVVDIDDDGRPDPAARIRLAGGEALEVEIVEVMTFDERGYRNDTSAVKAWHQRELRRLGGPQPGDAGADAGAPVHDDRRTLAEAIERGWHAIRSGESGAKALQAADGAAASQAPLGPGLAQAWVRWRGWLADATR
ncbi:MAG: VCBS repeat-containing protein [Deltaproteobacteria bacterium]|nr:VCBS repeat-containing protein [Deltaproteobacteria bacterium]